jgi:hypothetical protein
MPLQESGNAEPTTAKKVVSRLVDVAVRAFVRSGFNAQMAAGELGMGAADFSKAFSPNWPERNPIMKKWDALPYEVRHEFASLLAAEYGIGAVDSEQTRIIRDFARLLKETA